MVVGKEKTLLFHFKAADGSPSSVSKTTEEKHALRERFWPWIVGKQGMMMSCCFCWLEWNWSEISSAVSVCGSVGVARM